MSIEATDDVYETWSVVSHSLWLERAGILPGHRLLLRPHGRSGGRVSVSSWYRAENYTRRWTVLFGLMQQKAIAYLTRAQAAQAAFTAEMKMVNG